MRTIRMLALSLAVALGLTVSSVAAPAQAYTRFIKTFTCQVSAGHVYLDFTYDTTAREAVPVKVKFRSGGGFAINQAILSIYFWDGYYTWITLGGSDTTANDVTDGQTSTAFERYTFYPTTDGYLGKVKFTDGVGTTKTCTIPGTFTNA